jgi:hypothetical protein
MSVPAEQTLPAEPLVGSLEPAPADASPASPGTALALPERARAAIGLIDIEAKLQQLAAQTSSITAITNADGREQVHASAMALKEQRIAIEKAGKKAREDANKFASEVIVQQDKLIALIEPEEDRLLALRDEWDKARAEEKRVRAEADRKRQAEIQRRIQQDIRDVPASMANHSATDIDAAIRSLVALVVDESFGEFREVAEQAHANTLARLRSMHAQRVEFETEQERQRQRKAELDAEIERQRAERRLNEQRLKKITEIQQQAMVAAIGKTGRKPGTRECIALTLAETEQWPVTEAEFGDLYANAINIRDLTVQQIREQLARFDQREAESARQAELQRQQQEAAERQRAEQQRLDAERAAAQAEQDRIAAENARQAEELRRQQAELERQRQEQEAARAELERMQALANAVSVTVPANVLEGVDLKQPAGLIEVAPQAVHVTAQEFAPNAEQLIALVANEYGVSDVQAEQWLRAAFGGAQ